MARKRGTLASIAAEVGVSRTTVSNAYNHPDQLSPELRDRILAAAAARGYTGPDPTARSLRTRQVGAIGVILTEHLGYAFEDQASIDFLAGLSESSAGTRNALTLIPLGPNQGTEVSPLVAGAIVDGFVVYSVPSDEPHLEAVRARGVPTVVCDQPYPPMREGTGEGESSNGLPSGSDGGSSADMAYVGIDDAAAIAPAAQALVDAGHRRIGIIGKRLFRDSTREGAVTRSALATADMHVQRARITGALNVFDAAGITDVPVITRHFNDHDTAVDAAREMLTTHRDLTAVLCTTDSMAVGVLDYCSTAGLDVPRDLSVTGFDGVEQALARGLTTVIQPNKLKGETVGKMLTDLIGAESAPAPAGAAQGGAAQGGPPRIILPTEFSSGRTVAPPRE